MRTLLAMLFVVAGCAFEPGRVPGDDWGGGGGPGPGGGGGGAAPDANTVARTCTYPDPSLRLCLEMDNRVFSPMVIDGSVAQLDAATNAISETTRNNGFAAAFAAGSTISVPESPMLDLEAFTIEMWINPEYSHSTYLVTNQGQYYMSLAGDGRIGCILPNAQVWSFDDVDDDEWTHVACSFDGNILRAYIDGTVVGAWSFGNTTGINGAGTQGTVLGGSYVGRMDDIRIYGRALSTQEVCTHAGRTSCSSGSGPGPGGN